MTFHLRAPNLSGVQSSHTYSTPKMTKAEKLETFLLTFQLKALVVCDTEVKRSLNKTNVIVVAISISTLKIAAPFSFSEIL